MANFKDSFKKTLGHEGGYINDKDDRGGETYCGITRKWHKDWEGWKIIDNVKKKCDKDKLNKELNKNEKLQELVQSFYKKKYWDVMKLDKVYDEDIADVLFDILVNGGNPKKWTQTTLNILNRIESDWQDIAVDGKIGNKTITTLNYAAALTRGDYKLKEGILECLLSFRTMHFVDISISREKNEKFTNGWINRVIKQRKEINY